MSSLTSALRLVGVLERPANDAGGGAADRQGDIVLHPADGAQDSGSLDLVPTARCPVAAML